MTTNVHTSNSIINTMDAVTGLDIDLALFNPHQRPNQGVMLDRLEPDTSGSQTTSGSAAGTSSTPNGTSNTRTDLRNTKSVSSGVSQLLKYLLLGEIKVSVATLISVTLAILAVVYTVLSDNVGQKQLDLGKWVFCKSYPDDPQVQNSTTCQIYSQKKSLDDLRKRGSTSLSETPIQILDSVPDWLSVPSRIDRHSCQVVCWNSASSHSRVALAPARISRSYVDIARFALLESAIPRFRLIVGPLRLSYKECRVKIRSFMLESAIPQFGILTESLRLSYHQAWNQSRYFFHNAALPRLKGVLEQWLPSFRKGIRSFSSFIFGSIIPQFRMLISSPRFSYTEVMEFIRSLIFVDSIRSLLSDPAFPHIGKGPKLSYTEVVNSVRSQIIDPTIRKYIVIDIVLWLGLKALAPGVVLVAQLIYQYGMLLGKILYRPAIRLIMVAALIYLAILVVFDNKSLSK